MRNVFTMEPIPGLEKFVMPEKMIVKAATQEEIALRDIKSINQFYMVNAREPLPQRTNVEEYALCEKLHRLRFNAEKFQSVSNQDIYGLLGKPCQSNRFRGWPGKPKT